MAKFRGITWNNSRFGPKIQVRRSIDLAELGNLGLISQEAVDLPTRGAAHRADHGGSTSATRVHTDFRGIAGADSNVVDTQDLGSIAETATTHRVWSSTGAISDIVTSAPTSLDNPPTQQAHQFTNTRSAGHTFTVPAGVTSISAVAIGAGGGSDYFKGGQTVYMATAGWGGDLSYANNISVTPGEELKVYVGAAGPSLGSWYYAGFMSYTPTEGRAGGSSWIERSDGTVILRAKGGNGGGTVTASSNNDSNIGDVSYSGGAGSTTGKDNGGGGAAGYAGDGGDGSRSGNTNTSTRLPAANSGAGAGGGQNDGGGGVGIYGLGDTPTSAGDGGSGGTNGSAADGGTYGGGAGGRGQNWGTSTDAAPGAVRIVWHGNASFPSTNVGLSEDEQVN